MLVDSKSAWLLSNRGEARVTRLPQGFYGVSNATLDATFPKVCQYAARAVTDVAVCLCMPVGAYHEAFVCTP